MSGYREDWFPTSIWVFDHPDPIPLNEQLFTFILAERQRDPQGIQQRSHTLGWHSRDNLHLEAVFAPLQDFIEQSVAQVVAFAKWDLTRLTPTIATCWAMVNGKFAGNTVHMHPHSFLSGVYYVQAAANAGNVFFLDPRLAHVMTMPPVTAHHPWNYQRVIYKPQPGRLLIFPAWLEHGVEPNGSDSERMSISFNIGARWQKA